MRRRRTPPAATLERRRTEAVATAVSHAVEQAAGPESHAQPESWTPAIGLCRFAPGHLVLAAAGSVDRAGTEHLRAVGLDLTPGHKSRAFERAGDPPTSRHRARRTETNSDAR